MKLRLLPQLGTTLLFFLCLKGKAQNPGSIRPPIKINSSTDSAHTYKNQYLTAIDFPVGAIGGTVNRMNGRAERSGWQIFNNFEQRKGTGIVPNSFFAIRTKSKESTVVRTLQTSSAGLFPAIDGLSFQREYPLGWYNFIDSTLPVKVTLEAYNPLIPIHLKNSAIPCAIFRITVKNTSAGNVAVGLLGTQQNAVGFTGYYTIAGPNNRNCRGYGSNQNTIASETGRTSLKMVGTAGNMQLSAYDLDMTGISSWKNMTSLFNDFSNDGLLSGDAQAESPQAGITVDGALVKNFNLDPGAEKTITFVLSWYFPKGSFGRKDIPQWYFPEAGNQYENWWANAGDVDNYVFKNFKDLDAKTKLYHNTLYSSNIPRNVLDRISSNISSSKQSTVIQTVNEDAFAAAFATPQDSLKPWVYYYRISDNISKEGIPKDLEAMAKLGIGQE